MELLSERTEAAMRAERRAQARADLLSLLDDPQFVAEFEAKLRQHRPSLDERLRVASAGFGRHELVGESQKQG